MISFGTERGRLFDLFWKELTDMDINQINFFNCFLSAPAHLHKSWAWCWGRRGLKWRWSGRCWWCCAVGSAGQTPRCELWPGRTSPECNTPEKQRHKQPKHKKDIKTSFILFMYLLSLFFVSCLLLQWWMLILKVDRNVLLNSCLANQRKVRLKEAGLKRPVLETGFTERLLQGVRKIWIILNFESSKASLAKSKYKNMEQ